MRTKRWFKLNQEKEYEELVIHFLCLNNWKSHLFRKGAKRNRFFDILMIGSTTENLADILKVQYLKVRKNNKNHNFVLIQIKFRNIYLLIEQEEINRFLKLKKMSSYISMCKNSSPKFSLKYYIPKNFKCVHCSCTNDSTICQTSR